MFALKPRVSARRLAQLVIAQHLAEYLRVYVLLDVRVVRDLTTDHAILTPHITPTNRRSTAQHQYDPRRCYQMDQKILDVKGTEKDTAWKDKN